MSHSPPVPPGNKSTYPIVQPPHVDVPEMFAPAAGSPDTTTADGTADQGSGKLTGSNHDVAGSGGIGTAVKVIAGAAVAAVAVAIGVALAGQRTPETAGGRRKKAAKPGAKRKA